MEIYNWFFNTREGMFALIGIGIVVFFLVAVITERRTKKLFYNHKQGESIVDQIVNLTDPDIEPAEKIEEGESFGEVIADLRKEIDDWDPDTEDKPDSATPASKTD